MEKTANQRTAVIRRAFTSAPTATERSAPSQAHRRPAGKTRDVYCYFDNDDRAHAAQNELRLRELLVPSVTRMRRSRAFSLLGEIARKIVAFPPKKPYPSEILL